MSKATARKIPYVDLARQHAALKVDLLRAAEAVIDHGQFVLGPEVAQFESRIASLCGTAHAVGLNSGTDALILALRALGIGAGHEVITAPNSFVATASAIALVGAKPVFVDVDEDMNIDPERIESAITKQTRAIMPVHLTGKPANMDPILSIARQHKLVVIEDAAQSILAEYRGRRVGSIGDVGCFSMHPLKTLNACGDAGLLTTNDGELAEQIRVLRNIGLKTRENAIAWSGNSRLDTMQAAFLLVKLQHLEQWTERRRENAALYRAYLANIPALHLPAEHPCEKPVYHTFIIRTDCRDALKKHLEDAGVSTAIHYPLPIHLQTAAASLGYRKGDFPVAEKQAGEILSLPVYPELQEDDVLYVAEAVRAFFGV